MVVRHAMREFSGEMNLRWRAEELNVRNCTFKLRPRAVRIATVSGILKTPVGFKEVSDPKLAAFIEEIAARGQAVAKPAARERDQHRSSKLREELPVQPKSPGR